MCNSARRRPFEVISDYRRVAGEFHSSCSDTSRQSNMIPLCNPNRAPENANMLSLMISESTPFIEPEDPMPVLSTQIGRLSGVLL
jgi:hypothetical protein